MIYIVYKVGENGVGLITYAGVKTPEEVAVVGVPSGASWREVPSVPSTPQAQWVWTSAGLLGEAPYIPPTPEELLTQERLTMTCTPMQGILALGETQWNAILSYRDTQATWAEKVIVDGAQTWVRNSQNIAFFQYLLGLTDTQVDDLFRVAKTIEA